MFVCAYFVVVVCVVVTRGVYGIFLIAFSVCLSCLFFCGCPCRCVVAVFVVCV